MDIGQIAKILVDARLEGIRLPALPTPEPTNLASAYEIQDAAISLLDSPVVGWKVAATSDVGMQSLGIDHPLAGPLFQCYTHSSPAKLKTFSDSMCLIEAEFAFSIKHDLPPKAEDYTPAEVGTAIDAIHPAIEVVNTRCIEDFNVGANWVVADGTANDAFIYGKGIVNWQQFDLSSHLVEVDINGAFKGSGSGAAVLGGPINVLHWLVNHLRQRDITLKAGAFVSTGVTTPLITALKGDLIEANFGALGSIELEIK